MRDQHNYFLHLAVELPSSGARSAREIHDKDAWPIDGRACCKAYFNTLASNRNRRCRGRLTAASRRLELRGRPCECCLEHQQMWFYRQTFVQTRSVSRPPLINQLTWARTATSCSTCFDVKAYCDSVTLAKLSNIGGYADSMQVPSAFFSRSARAGFVICYGRLSRSNNDVHRLGPHYRTAHASVPLWEGRRGRFKMFGAAHFLIRCAVVGTLPSALYHL